MVNIRFLVQNKYYGWQQGSEFPRDKDNTHSTVTLGVPNMINDASNYSFASQCQQVENRVVNIGAFYYPPICDGYHTIKDKIILKPSPWKDKKRSGQCFETSGGL